MALIAFTNPSTENTLYIDVDKGDRDNNYAQFKFTPSLVMAVDEADINPLIDSANTFPRALKSGQLTITTADLDNVTDLKTRNFLASGLGLHYYYAAGAYAVSRILAKANATGLVTYPAANTEELLGVSQEAASSLNDYKKVYSILGTSVTVDVGSSNIAVGDKIGADTDGKAIPVTTVGHKYLGVATVAAVAGATITFTINSGTVA